MRHERPRAGLISVAEFGLRQRGKPKEWYMPYGIWTSDLTAAERCLWAEIDSFTSNNGNGYYKTNQQASEELGVSQRQVSRAFAKLESMGLITLTKKGVRRVAKSTPWQDVLDCVASNPRHDGEVSSPQWRGIKNKEKNNKEHNKNTLVYAIEGDEMIELWDVWKRERKAFVKGTYTHIRSTESHEQIAEAV
jgi:DNA-binding transcriptional ArsR family regulator